MSRRVVVRHVIAWHVVACAVVPARSMAGHGGALLAQTPPSVLARSALDEPVSQHLLSIRLREISGLASTRDGRLLAHDDERAVVYEIDPDRGALRKGFGLGRPVVRGDFEGIAVTGDRVYLVTSDGVIHEASEGVDDERVAYRTYRTGVGEVCEIEGLAHDPVGRALLLVCKNPRVDRLRGRVAIFRWALATRSIEGPPIIVDAAALTGPIGTSRFQPSAIERDPETGHYLLVAGPQRAIAEVAAEGTVVAVRLLDRDRHPQPEGATILAGRWLLIADEGAGRSARLTRYAIRSGDPP